MASESIRFDFLTSGGPELARQFKSAGDNAAAAARGAKVLSDIIGTLGQKEDRTAAQSALLAKALRQTGDAEDRAAAKAVAADAAIRRLDDALQKEERDALEAAAANRALGDSFGKVAEKAGGGSLKGALAALTPALIPLTGGIAAGVAAVGVSFGGAAIGAGLFGAAAKSVLSGASSNLAKLQALQVAADKARTVAGRKAALQQIADLKGTWSAGYLDMIDALEKFKAKWTSVSQDIAVPALTTWIHALTGAIGFLEPAVLPVADVFTSWGQAVDRYFKSDAGSAEVTRLATAFGRFSASQLKDTGVFIADIGRGIFSLAQDLAGHNIDFGTFGKHLDEWGAAFARWSSSAAARQDVSKFLAYIGSNGPAVAGLLKNLGGTLAVFAPGLSSVGQLELKLVSDFLGFLARTPQAVAKPLIDAAGALLLLQKTGVLKVGIKIVGAAVQWLTKGTIDIGGGAAAGAEIRAAFASGGAAAAAEIRAALAGGGAAGGAGGIGGGAAAGATAGKAAGGGFLTALRAAITPAAAGVIAGALIRAAGDTLSPAGTFAGNLNKQFQADGHMWSTTLLHSFTFGGLEAWLTAKIGEPVGGALNNIGRFVTGSWGKTQNFLTGSWDKTSRTASSIWGGIAGFVSGAWHKIAGDSTSGSKAGQNAFGAAGRAADALRTRNLTPLLGDAGKVSGGIQGLAGTITGRFNSAVNSGGSHVNAFRTQNLGPLQGSLSKTTGGVQGLQHYINLLHGKTVAVGVTGSGSGGVVITTSGIAAAGQGNVRFHAARGAYVSTGTGPTADDNLARVSKGELIVPARMVSSGAVDHLRGRIPGFAAGGLVGIENTLGSVAGTAASYEGRGAAAAMAAGVKAAIAREKAAVNKAAAAKAALTNLLSGALGSGPLSASAAVAQAFAKSILYAYGWGQNQFPPLQALWNQESGWNSYAVNPSSGAYGIPQALGHGHPYNLGDYQAQIRWGLAYISQRYGTPAAAEGHELAYHWYDKGGYLPAGVSLAVNNTGRPEQVIPPGGAGAGRGNVTVVLENHGVIGSQQQLEDWLVKSVNKMAQHGRLTQAVRAASR